MKVLSVAGDPMVYPFACVEQDGSILKLTVTHYVYGQKYRAEIELTDEAARVAMLALVQAMQFPVPL